MLHLITFILVSVILTWIILVLAYGANNSVTDFEKHSAYECGFEPFGDARSFFDVHFYIVGLLFIVFDLEIVFLAPLAANTGSMSAASYISFLIFMLILLIGFYLRMVPWPSELVVLSE